jgi:D-aminoacyl-tRNA deacylase
VIAVVQRVTEARVVVNGATVGEIGPGLLALVAVQVDDTAEDVKWMAGKLTTLRIFRNGEKHFDFDVQQSGGAVLLVSNFTVAGKTKQGRRPSFDAAAKPEVGRKFLDELVGAVKSLGIKTATGEFGADMTISLVNDGPSTFIVNSKE